MRVTGRVGCKTLHTVRRVRGRVRESDPITFVVDKGYLTITFVVDAVFEDKRGSVSVIKAFHAFLGKVLKEALRKK